LDYLRFLISRDPDDLKNFVTEKTIISLARKGFISYVPISAPSPLRGRWAALHHVFDELRRDLRDDGIAVGAQLPHSAGNPMSQREKAGLSWPRFSVDAGEPFKIIPACCDNGMPVSCGRGSAVPRWWSRAIGEHHPASLATSFNGRALTPC
jgi:hypothetical protein